MDVLLPGGAQPEDGNRELSVHFNTTGGLFSDPGIGRVLYYVRQTTRKLQRAQRTFMENPKSHRKFLSEFTYFFTQTAKLFSPVIGKIVKLIDNL